MKVKLCIMTCLCGLLINPMVTFGASYTIKTHYLGQTRYDFASASETAPLRTELLSSSNFGAGGTVEDIEFTSVIGTGDFSESSLADADIFVAIFAEGSSRSITATEAQTLKNFVDSGKSLFVIADYDSRSLNSANLLGTLFGGVTFSSYNTAGSTSITDHSSLSLISDGPFGSVNTISWTANAVPNITNSGDSTIIDSNAIFSIIAPTETSGSVFFFHDPANILWLYATGDIEALALNMFNYAANSINDGSTVVPEPASFLLLGLTLIGLARKKIR